ncbi:MAG: TMEM175 family protein [Merismopediaceae bacterium]|nr:TMEM175 family protein [Merismopediaceae bacterium]
MAIEETPPPSTKQPLLFAVHGNERINAFSDGVFAITITLLVLEIKVPEIPHELVATELMPKLTHLFPFIMSHVISFFVLGIFWVAHHNMFAHIKKHDHVLLWLNLLFLLCVASAPFPTGLLGAYPDQAIAVMIYSGVLAVTGLSLDLIWWYVTTYGLVDGETDSEFVRFVHWHIWKAPIFYGLAFVFAFLNWLALAKLILIGVTIFYIIPNALERTHYKRLNRRFNQ